MTTSRSTCRSRAGAAAVSRVICGSRREAPSRRACTSATSCSRSRRTRRSTRSRRHRGPGGVPLRPGHDPAGRSVANVAQDAYGMDVPVGEGRQRGSSSTRSRCSSSTTPSRPTWQATSEPGRRGHDRDLSRARARCRRRQAPFWVSRSPCPTTTAPRGNHSHSGAPQGGGWEASVLYPAPGRQLRVAARHRVGQRREPRGARDHPGLRARLRGRGEEPRPAPFAGRGFGLSDRRATKCR